MHSGWSAGKQLGNSFCDSGTSWPLPKPLLTNALYINVIND